MVKVLLIVLALMHIYFLWLEMFAWETVGKKVFRNFDPSLFKPTRKLAANQGLYNGFLAAGLLWPIFIGDAYWAGNIAYFFSGCVLVAGTYGGVTTAKRIFYVQGIPALVTLISIYALGV